MNYLIRRISGSSTRITKSINCCMACCDIHSIKYHHSKAVDRIPINLGARLNLNEYNYEEIASPTKCH